MGCGTVTAGTLLGLAASTIGAQFFVVYARVYESSALLLGAAVLATLATGLLLARSAPDHAPLAAGHPR
ncbi:hypothetical protein AB0H83_46015 [Dactylosporangium sp. NPDC050688]|uniref:hypothetical protein n=1 Tax=Dactylosporangium sp. NPDC050688 TaxID=3157217 RepID=UPI0033F42A05